MCPTEWLVLDKDGNLIQTNDCNWNEETKSFYLDYQRDYGIGGSLIQEMMQNQTEFYNLPDSLKAMLSGFGMSKNLFAKPTRESCLERYISSRRIFFNDQLVLMPLV